MESDDLIVLDGDNEDLSPQVVSRRVNDGDYILKKNSKGSRAWERFRAVLNPSNNDEVFGVACCCVCKVCILYKTKVSGEERSLGTKNMLDHMKRCLPARASAPRRSDSSGGGSS